jgi:hypothetical protein
MTAVYSGGLVYEYSQEEANYGLVDISGSSVTERPDFSALQDAYKKTPAPSGDGGYKSTSAASTCPPQAANWKVSGDSLPAIPKNAEQYMKSGAGKGPGNVGTTGSQNAGTASEGTTGTTGSTASSTTSKAAAASVRVPEFALAPLACAAVLIVSSVLGGASMFL